MDYGAQHKDSVFISVRVPASVAARLKSDAKALNWSTALLVRRILRLYISHELKETVCDLIPGYKVQNNL